MEKPVGNKKPGLPPFAKQLSEEDIVKQIQEAEKGSFYTSAEVREHLKKWKSKRA